MSKMVLREFWVRHRDQLIEKIYRLMNRFDSLTPDLSSSPPLGKKILLIAPHCDDETLGCGGTIYRYHQAGCEVEVVFITESADENIAVMRRKESKNAASILGIHDCHYLKQRELTLKPTSESIFRFRELIEHIDPDILYLPHQFENQPDHRYTYQLVVSALENYSREITCLCYEVWSTLMPNILVDITNVVEVKRRAIQCYQSQLQSNDYLEKIMGLNRYRSIVAEPEIRYVEGSFKTSSKNLKTVQ